MRNLAFPALLTLSACVPAGEPLVSDYNGDSVKIAMTNWAGEGVRSDITDAEALRICNKGGKRTAEYASSRMVNDYQLEHLYLCL
ncbi:MAG: hypothetical protein MUE52_04200 [Tabrizicola sp.]|jgi:hypothetical protein|nr:hypothetical protein [Tabrizicola sp.]